MGESSGYAVPSGGIIGWTGSVANIPQGWFLCDGTNGTPNMADKFVVGSITDSGGTHDVGDTGGANSVTLTEAQMPAHSHSLTIYLAGNSGGSPPKICEGDTNTSLNGNTVYTSSTVGSSQSHENRPAFYAWAWIMKS